jgi:hypothetical protein
MYWVLLAIILIYLIFKQRCLDGFGMSEKPMEHDNSLLMRNPWDDIDYIVPKFYKL